MKTNHQLVAINHLVGNNRARIIAVWLIVCSCCNLLVAGFDLVSIIPFFIQHQHEGFEHTESLSNRELFSKYRFEGIPIVQLFAFRINSTFYTFSPSLQPSLA
jgi:hypothetical protein